MSRPILHGVQLPKKKTVLFEYPSGETGDCLQLAAQQNRWRLFYPLCSVRCIAVTEKESACAKDTHAHICGHAHVHMPVDMPSHMCTRPTRYAHTWMCTQGCRCRWASQRLPEPSARLQLQRLLFGHPGATIAPSQACSTRESAAHLSSEGARSLTHGDLPIVLLQLYFQGERQSLDHLQHLWTQSHNPCSPS